MEKIITRGTALNSLGFFNFHGPSNVENGFTFPDGETPPTEEVIQAEIIKLQAEYDALQFQRDRIYPQLGEQLDMQYWDQVNGTTTWKDAIAKVKSDNPKPE